MPVGANKNLWLACGFSLELSNSTIHEVADLPALCALIIIMLEELVISVPLVWQPTQVHLTTVTTMAAPGFVKTACVTGGNGYIASALVKMLLQKGYAVKTTVRDPGSIGSF